MQSLIEFPFSVSGQEDMALRNEQRDFIRDEIKVQLSLAADVFKPHGFRRVTHFLWEWGLAGAAITVPLTLLAICVAVGIFAVSGIKENTQFRTHTEDKLATIEGEVKAIRRDLATQSLINHAFLPLPDFKATLPEVGFAIAAAKQQEVKVAPKVINNLQQKLIASGERDPGFWPTTAQFISYRSSLTAPALKPNLPDCTDRDPSLPKVTDVERQNPPKFTFNIPIYEGCRLTLDSQKDNERINWLLVHKLPFIAFKRCLIVYRGGAVNLIVAFDKKHFVVHIGDNPKGPTMFSTFSGHTLSFADCIFDFSFDSAPPIEGQRVAESLLVQTGPSLNLYLKPPSTQS